MRWRRADPIVVADDARGERLEARLEDLRDDLAALGEDILAMLDELRSLPGLAD